MITKLFSDFFFYDWDNTTTTTNYSAKNKKIKSSAFINTSTQLSVPPPPAETDIVGSWKQKERDATRLSADLRIGLASADAVLSTYKANSDSLGEKVRQVYGLSTRFIQSYSALVNSHERWNERVQRIVTKLDDLNRAVDRVVVDES